MKRYFSPAKLNLFFRVLSRRSDGFHEIASLFQTIDLGDVLEIAAASQDQLTCTDKELPCDERNLVVKALHLFRRKTGMETFSIRCHLEKKIPKEAGLGGGSSNAATMLWACNEIAGYPVSVQQLAEWSAEIGSDVPFFFSSGSAYCTGRGERMVDQSFRAECILPRGQTWIAKPSFGVSTPQAYQACQPQELPQRNPLAVLEGFLKGQPEFFNDLEHSVFRLAPDLSAIKRKLQEMNFSSVVMTGSGSAFICVGSASPKPIEDVQFFSIQPQQRQPAGWYSSPL